MKKLDNYDIWLIAKKAKQTPELINENEILILAQYVLDNL